jgi:phytoene dehydrogenase-like protein
MEDRSILVVGAGMAGLATGCYARMNGYATHIVEMAPRPGGVCTSWRRGDYVFDGCIEWLMGSRPGSPLNRTWQELGALTGRTVVDHDEYLRIECHDGKNVVIYTDADRLERHLCELSPADAATSRLLCNLIRRAASLMQGRGVLASGAALLPVLLPLVSLVGTTWQGFAARYTDRFLRDAIRTVADLPDFPLLAGVMMLAGMHARDSGYPIGGSLAFAQAVEQRYLELGGDVTYRARVVEILVENDRAVGVMLEDGRIFTADRVVSAADGHSTLFEMLGGRYADRRIQRRYAPQRVFPPLVQVSLGVERDLSDTPHALQFRLRSPVTIAGETREELLVRHYCYDPTLAPRGKSVVELHLQTNYDLWARLAGDPDAYEAEKHAIADTVVAALDERFPGLAASVEVVDVATPMTWVRHTGNWRGAFEGWLPTRSEVTATLRGRPSTLPGLDGFYMVGQWAQLGGLPSVAPAGRDLVRRFCREDGRQFGTTMATHPPARLLPDFDTHAGEVANEHLTTNSVA